MGLKERRAAAAATLKLAGLLGNGIGGGKPIHGSEIRAAEAARSPASQVHSGRRQREG